MGDGDADDDTNGGPQWYKRRRLPTRSITHGHRPATTSFPSPRAPRHAAPAKAVTATDKPMTKMGPAKADNGAASDWRTLMILAVGTFALTACGSDNAATQTVTVTVPMDSTASATAPPTPTARPAVRRDESNAILKNVGELAGVSCPGGPEDPCDIDFTVTAIEPNFDCVDPYNISPLAPGQQYLRFSVDAKAADKMVSPVTRALNIGNWAVEDASGVLWRNLDIASSCSGPLDAVMETFVPGTRMLADVTVIVPSPVAELRLIVTPESWVWQVP